MVARFIEQKTLKDNETQYFRVGDMLTYDGFGTYFKSEHVEWRGDIVPEPVVTSPFDLARDRFAQEATALGADVFTVLGVTEHYFTGYAYKKI